MYFYTHRFESLIQEHSMGFNAKGELIYTVLFLPDQLTNDLPLAQNPRLRVEGEMHGIPFEGALQPARGKWYLLISRSFMKEQGLALGDAVEVSFNVGDPNHVKVPVELEEALNANSRALAVWEGLTAGKRRGYASHVSSAKQAATRKRRASKMIQYIVDGKNSGGRSF